MKKITNIKKEHVWLFCMGLGPMIAFTAVFYPAISIIAIIFMIIGIKGILTHVM
jgi:hypothetical protein